MSGDGQSSRQGGQVPKLRTRVVRAHGLTAAAPGGEASALIASRSVGRMGGIGAEAGVDAIAAARA